MGSGNPTRELISEAYNLFDKDAHLSVQVVWVHWPLLRLVEKTNGWTL
jgi:hypothetical protein